MAMSQPRRTYRADDLYEFPDDGNRYEVIDGELFVTPAPRREHQRALGTLYMQLRAYAERMGIEVMFAPVGVRASEDTEVEPDLIALPRHFEGRDDTRWEQMPRLLLAVEILSRSTEALDREVKRRLYMAQRVREYWIVDLDVREVSVWTLHGSCPHVCKHELSWQPSKKHEPLVVNLVALFREVHGEVQE